MKIKFFDSNIYMGIPQLKSYKPVSTAAGLISELDRQGIEKALVWHISQYFASPIDGNEILPGIIKGEGRLYGCWVLLPPQTGEVIAENFFSDMRINRIFALRAFPDFHKFILDRTVFGSFLDEASERKIPLLLSMERGNSWQGVYALMKDYPALTCILCDIGVWGMDRYTWPLLEKYGNLYLETSLLALGCGQLESTVKKFGSGRIVFGSGFPDRYPESSVLEVLHSDISKQDREKIAHLNMECIIAGVKL